MNTPIDELKEAVERIKARWLEYVASPTHGDFEEELIQMLVDTLDAHARFYLHNLESQQHFLKSLRETGGACLRNALRPSVGMDHKLPVGFIGKDGSFGPSTGPLSLAMLPIAETRFEARYAYWSAEARAKLRMLLSSEGPPLKSHSTRAPIENFLTAASDSVNCPDRITKMMFWRAAGYKEASCSRRSKATRPNVQRRVVRILIGY